MLQHSVPLALSPTFSPDICSRFPCSRRPAVGKKSKVGNHGRRLSVHSSWKFARNKTECGEEKSRTSKFDKVEERMREIGRCALVGSAAALLVQCVSCEAFLDDATAATSPPVTQARSYSPSISSGEIDAAQCLNSPPLFTNSLKKNSRGGKGIHGKQNSSLLVGFTKQTSLTTGTRRGLQLVKRSSPAYYQFREFFLSRQLGACSSASALPIASLSPSIATSSFATIARLVSRVDVSVLRSSFGTSFNLFSLCSLVVWLQRSGNLPAETPVILSQVAFRLFIPCFLLSKVATTLITQPAENLIGLPLIAIAQVITGAFLGKLACQVFFREPQLQTAVEWSRSEASDSSSLAAEFAEQPVQIVPRATKKQALIVAACAFNNSLTLPLVFMSGVLGSPEEANRAAGYLALYMVGWSPAMWTVGYKILTSGDEVPEVESRDGQPWWKTARKWIGSVMNPPLYGVLIGLLIGGTPLSHLFLGGREGIPLVSSHFDTIGALAKLRSVTAGILSPVFEAVTLLGTATLAVQTVVLATSLGASLPKQEEDLRVTSSPKEIDLQQVEVLEDHEASLMKSHSALDSKAFWVISLVRLLIMPFTGICLISILQKANLLPPDSIYKLTILTETAMPTAQNLVLLAQLNAGTRPLAGTLANLLLRQYALSVIPITLWMAIFLSLPSG